MNEKLKNLLQLTIDILASIDSERTKIDLLSARRKYNSMYLYFEREIDELNSIKNKRKKNLQRSIILTRILALLKKAQAEIKTLK